MESNGYSLSDVVAALGGNNNVGGGMGLFVIVILFLFVVMFMGGAGGGKSQYATQEDIHSTAQYGNLLDGNRDLSNLITEGTAQAVAATNRNFTDSLSVIQDKYNEITRDIAALHVGQANAMASHDKCCCETKMLIQQTAADNALQMSQMEARINSKMDANEIQSLRDQIGQLQLQQATAGVLRYPDSWTYGAGPFPPIFGDCCNNQCCGQRNI